MSSNDDVVDIYNQACQLILEPDDDNENEQQHHEEETNNNNDVNNNPITTTTTTTTNPSGEMIEEREDPEEEEEEVNIIIPKRNRIDFFNKNVGKNLRLIGTSPMDHMPIRGSKENRCLLCRCNTTAACGTCTVYLCKYPFGTNQYSCYQIFHTQEKLIYLERNGNTYKREPPPGSARKRDNKNVVVPVPSPKPKPVATKKTPKEGNHITTTTTRRFKSRINPYDDLFIDDDVPTRTYKNNKNNKSFRDESNNNSDDESDDNSDDDNMIIQNFKKHAQKQQQITTNNDNNNTVPKKYTKKQPSNKKYNNLSNGKKDGLIIQEVERVEENGYYYGTIHSLWLNNPTNYNVLSMEMLTDLNSILKDINNDTDCRVVILGAAENSKGFCVGHDVKEIIANDVVDNQELFRMCSDVMTQIQYRVKQPILCQVSGLATAAGCQLVASCDIVIALDIPTTKFAVSGINVGLFGSPSAVALSRILPPKKALELLLTGNYISASEAYQFGIINHLVSSYDELRTKTKQIARTIAMKSPYAIRRGKEMFYQQLQIQNRDEAYAYANERIINDIQSNDAQEGITAFLHNRQPQWKSMSLSTTEVKAAASKKRRRAK